MKKKKILMLSTLVVVFVVGAILFNKYQKYKAACDITTEQVNALKK